MGRTFALLRWSTLRYAENVGSRLLSLRQRSPRNPFSRWDWTAHEGQRRRPVAGWALNCVSAEKGLHVLSSAIFSGPLDSAELVQSFEPAKGARDEFLLAATAQNLRKLAKLIPIPSRMPA